MLTLTLNLLWPNSPLELKHNNNYFKVFNLPDLYQFYLDYIEFLDRFQPNKLLEQSSRRPHSSSFHMRIPHQNVNNI